MNKSLTVALSACLIPAAASAVMHPMYYRQARMEAAHHVQIRVLGVTGPRNGIWGDCVVRGRIARVFKGDLPTPVGGALTTPTLEVRKAKVLEAFLNGTPANIVRDQAVILPRLTDTPACDPAAEGFRCEPIAR
jgi:hypothetical protein